MNRLRVIKIDSVVNGIPLIDLRPPDGSNYEIIDAWGFHDDTIDCTTYWTYTEGGASNIQKGSSAVASTVRKPISSHITSDGSSITGKLIATRSVYPQFGTDSITGGKIVKIRALVREYDADVL